jgi:diacylglycerol O-acyltransferase
MMGIDSRVRPVIERASPTDLAMLAMDAGPVPSQVGAVLLLDAGSGFDVSAAEGLLADRIRAVPRLRQRLVRVPPGCGRPIWVDDADFDVGRHLRHLRCPPPGDERALLELATTMVTDPLPGSRPLWSAAFITGLTGNAAALVVVFHHVLADGVGGLAALAGLVDQAARPTAAAFPRHPPTAAQLAADAVGSRLRALLRLPVAWRDARAAVAAAGGVHAARAARCSLLRPTGPRRRVGVVRADLAGLAAVTHRHGGTVNDVVLAAVTGALHMLLEQRGESVDTFAVTVPVAGRRSTSAARLGNRISPMQVVLPGTGDPPQRLAQISAATRARRASATGPAAVALLGPVFRAAAGLGLFRWYLHHQRRTHTLVSNVRGPDRPPCLAGAAVSTIIPVAVGEAGNITVSFVVLSYAGTLTITAVVDPDRVPDLPTLTTALEAELSVLTSSPAAVPSSS